MDTVEEASGYTANFIGDVADYLKCKICMMVLKDPLMLVDCGHKFCTSCFNAMKTHTRAPSVRCPVDRGIVNNKKVFPDKAIERIILDLHVKCDHQQSGCLWSGELRKLAPHLEEDCIFEERKRNSVQLNEQKEKIEECESTLANMKTEKENMKNTLDTLKNMINCLQYQFTECNRQLQDTRTELECIKLQHKADSLKQQQKQCRLDSSQVTENASSIDNEIEISNEDSNEVAVAKVSSTQSEGCGGVGSRLRKRKLLANDNGDDENGEECSESETGSAYKSRLRKKPLIMDEDDEPLIHLSALFYEPKENYETNVGCEESSIIVDQEVVNNPIPNNDIIRVSNGQTNSLNDRMLVVEELTKYRKTVFKWTLLEYNAHKDMGDAVFSPMFYSSVNGHCCRLWLRWANDETALDLSFQICGVNKEDMKRKPLQRDVTLEMFNMYGEKKNQVIPSSLFLNSTGYTFKSFLKLTELYNFVNNDSLFIKCILKSD